MLENVEDCDKIIEKLLFFKKSRNKVLGYMIS